MRSVAYLPALILLPTIYFQVNKKAINVWPTANKHAAYVSYFRFAECAATHKLLIAYRYITLLYSKLSTN